MVFTQLIRIYDDFSFLATDFNRIVINHVFYLQNEVIELVRITTKKLESQYSAIIFGHTVNQSWIRPFTIVSGFTDKDNQVTFFFVVFKQIDSSSQSVPASSPASGN